MWLDFNVDSESVAALIRPNIKVVYRDDDKAVIGNTSPPMVDARTVVPPGLSQQQVPSDANTLLTDIDIHHSLPPGFE